MPSRRRFLLSAVLAAGLAGCTGGESPDRTGPSATATTTGAAETADAAPTDARTTVEPTRETPRAEAVEWRVAFDRPVETRPTVEGDAVYVAVGRRGVADPDDPRATGALAALDTDDGAWRWTSRLPAPPARAPRVHDGGVYCVAGRSGGFAGTAKRLLRFDPDGTERWQTDPVDQFLALLAFGGGRAYLGTSDDAVGLDGQRLFAVGLPDGDVRWSVESGDAFRGTHRDGSLLVGLGGHAVARHDARTGARRWRRRVETVRAADGSLVTPAGAVVVGSPPDADGRLAALDAADGSLRWSYAEGGGAAFVPSGVALADGAVVGSEYDGRVFALDAADGAERWTVVADGETRLPPVVADGTVFVREFRSDAGDAVRALDAETGETRWTADLPGTAGPLRAGSETVAVGIDDGRSVRALDAADGSLRWSLGVDGRLSEPVIAGDAVYVASERGVVRKLRS